MNDLVGYVKHDGPLTMSSLEIAELCQKKHNNVVRDIKRMLTGLGEGLLKFEQTYVASNGETYPCYHLPKDLTLTLVAGYNVLLRKRIIDRWMELEKQVATAPAPQVNIRDPLLRNQLMLQLLEEQGQLLEEKRQLEAQVGQMLPEVEGFKRIAASNGSLCITDAAKDLQLGPKQLTAWLRENKWVYSRPGTTRLVAYQEFINKGYLETKVYTYMRDDVEHTASQARVTPKGLTAIAKEFGVALP